jgi:short subunit dehydrogenase-like uncharacterized protein
MPCGMLVLLLRPWSWCLPQDAHRDPGYYSTSRMLLESGLCLALQSAELKQAGMLQGGVLTPATAMGPLLIDRLREAGFTFRVRE